MIKRVDHVSIGVRDLENAKAFFIEKLGGKELFCAPADGQGFRWTTIELGTSCLIELVDPIGEKGFLHRFLAERGEGVHHITIQVDNAAELEAQLRAKGIPTFGFNDAMPGWTEFFVHPRDAFGTLLQFAEFDPLLWINPGYVPECYREFAPPEADERLEVRRVEGGDGAALEIRKGGRTLRLEAGEAEELARLLREAAR